MPITQEQLDAIKAANHAKSQAWEATTFTDGDRVLSHGLTVMRSDSLWICEKTGTDYTTLSRWIRHKLGRRSYDVKTGAYLLHGHALYSLFLIPPVTQRNLYQPWNPASTQPVNAWFLAQRRQEEVAAPEQPLAALEARLNALREPVAEDRITVLEERIKALEERLLAVAAVAAHTALFKERIEALEAK
jgi:hypothetical protein